MIEKKFKILEDLIAKRHMFDFVVHYEDFVRNRKKVSNYLAEIANDDFFFFKRSKDEILSYNNKKSLWCRENYLAKYNFGNIHWAKGIFEKGNRILML
jgi:hypothetical protein